MRIQSRLLNGVRELGPIFLVAVGVALASTLAGSVLDHVHQVDAEGLVTQETPATPAPNHTQILTIKDWHVQFTLPLAAEIPLISYAAQGPSSIGLSSGNLSRANPTCSAATSALGTIIRYPAGAYHHYPHGAPIEYFITSINGYDYGYQLSQNACVNTAANATAVNRETSVISEALSSLAPSGN